MALVGIAGLAGAVGCGSRSSTLDQDVYATSGHGGSSGNKPSGSAGKMGGGLLGTAGASTTPTTPSSGVNAALAGPPCERYCAGYGKQCRQRLDGKDCLTTCQAELNGSGPFCQSLGIDTLTCLTPYFNANGGDCGSAVSGALRDCGDLVADFDDCKNEFAAGKQNPVASCPRSDAGTSGANCISIFSCSSGPYVTFCNSTESKQLAECNCAAPDGTTSIARVPVAGDLCFAATALCQ